MLPDQKEEILMIIDAVAKAATIEEAQQAAIKALNAPEEVDVKFEVLTFPEKKKFGIFGGKDAEVRAFYEVPDAPVKKPEPKPQPKKDKAPKKKQPKKQQKPQQKAQPKPQAKKEAPAHEEKQTEEVTVPAEEVREPVSLQDCPDSVKRAYDYLSEIISKIGITDATINVFKNEKEYFFQVLSEQDYSLIIGRRGETLDSIQYLVRLAANRGHEEGKAVRISINVGDYRQKRERTLREIARKNARRVRKFGRNVTLNPMNPSERRIIHTTVSEIEGVVSYSIGAESERRVVISLAEGVKPLSDKPRRNNNRRYNNNRGGRGGNRGGYRGNRDNNRSDRSESKPAAEEPKRAPRSDAEGVLYGKITPKKPAEPKPENNED